MLAREVVWDASHALHKYVLSWLRGIVLILSFGSSMGFYVSLALVYLEVSCDIVHLSKKDK